jgi:nitroimidazol reductase NimA-like FMN-containing flavoprotein (pyridoxamine 5'-phosphate oxidase superfamily)
MTEMSNSEIRRFLMKDTFTGKLATVKKDGSSHVVPIWFVLDEKNRLLPWINGILFDGDIPVSDSGCLYFLQVF